ncbi:MAG: hypothetical protein J1F36_01650 [Clostridiales bacterium]|nr:hypothetical protein [Clostridiales bacterium]
MITVKEYSYDDAKQIVDDLGGFLTPDERVLIMDEEGEKIGASVIGLDKTVVEIRQIIVKDRPFPYYDLLARSTLNLINLFELPIMVRVKSKAYFKPFGFIEASDGFMYIRSDKIVFKGSICGQ